MSTSRSKVQGPQAPWTVDREDIMRKLIEIGADMLITNVPDVARKIVDEG